MSRGQYPRRDPAEVEAVALWAQRTGRPITVAIANHYGIETNSAKFVLRTARRRGANIPTRQPTPPVKAHPATRRDLAGLHLACDCGHTYPVDQPDQLLRHTLTTHHRQPTRTERTPRTSQAAA